MVDIVTLYEDPWVNPTGSQDVPHHLNPYIYGGIGDASYKPLYGARLCTLTSAISCVVTEEINGIYTLDMEYPIDGVGADYIKIGRVISAKNNPFNSSQLFRIIKITRTLRKTFKVSAEHLSYDLDDYTIQPFSVGQFDTHLADMLSYAQGLDWGEDGSHYPYGYILGYQRYIDSEQGPEYIKQNFPFRFVIDGYYHTPGDDMPDPSYAVSAYPAPIDYWSTKKTMYSEKVSTVREFIGGANTGLLATFGGELWYNISDDGHADIIFTKQRGTNRGFVIKYGKNLMSMTYDVRGGKQHSAWYPYYRYCSNADNHEYLFWDIEDDLMNALDILHDLPVPPFEGQIKRPSPDSPYLVYDHYEDVMTYVNIFPVDITQYADLTLKASGYTWEELVETSDTLSAAEKRRRRVLRSYIIVGGLQSYFEASGASYAPTSSEVTCDFETLYGPGSGNEYKKALEELRLGDTVTLLYDEAGHSEQMRIRKMEYDSVTGRYKKLTLGSIKDKKQSAAASIASSSLHSEGEQEKQYSNAASFTTDVKKIIGQIFDNDVFATTPLGKEYHIDPNTGDPILTINASGIGTIVHGAVDPLYLDAQNHVNLRYSSIDFLPDRTDNNALKLKNPLPAAVTGEDEDKYLYVDDNGYISWDDLRLATSSVVGGIKTGYATSGTNFAVQLDQNGKAFVAAVYGAQDPIYLDGTTFKLRYSTTDFTIANHTIKLVNPLPTGGSDGQVLMWNEGPDWTTLTTSDISNIETWISGKSYATTTYVNEIASGLSAAYSVRVGQNPSFNSQSDYITITGPITTTTGASIPLSSLKVGDVVYVTDTDIPDRWVSAVTSSSATLYTLETVKPAVTDVQINSSSIVSNRVANIALSSSFGFNTTNNTLSLQKAGSSTLGGIKTGYVPAVGSKDYAVMVDTNGNAHVIVPWESVSNGTNAGDVLIWSAENLAWEASTAPWYLASNPNNYISRSGISATGAIAYNNSTGVISVASGYTIPTSSSYQPSTWNAKQDNLGTGTEGQALFWHEGGPYWDSLPADTNTWRPVKYGSTTLNDTSTTLEFVAGTNIGLAFSSGKLTITNNYSYTLPLAANGTRGGIQIGYSQSGKNYPVQLSSEKAYVNVPWTDTTYSLAVGTGANVNKIILSQNGTALNTITVPYATVAGEATKDSDSNTIADYYGHALTISGNTIGLKNAQDDDITGSFITVPYATNAGTAASASSVAWANVSGHDAGVDADLGISSSGSTTKYLSQKGTWVDIPTDVNTWRDIGVNGEPWKGTGTGTGPIDFTNDAGISITTGTGQNANKLYIGHSNSISAVTTAGFYKVKFDAQGHITGTASVAASDIPDLAASKITSGTFDAARIPSLSYTKITGISGTSPISYSGGAISLSNAYGDTKNPYGTKTPNYVLAGPASGTTAVAPTFRALVAKDIPNLTSAKITDLGDIATLGIGTGLQNDGGNLAVDSAYISNLDTWRPVKYSTTTLSDKTTTLEFAAGSNVQMSFSSGKLTVSATDTTYESKAAASGGTAVSLVTTGEKYTWNAKYAKPSGGIPASDLAESYYLASNPNGYTSNTGTVTSVTLTSGTGITVSNSGTAITTSGSRTISLNVSGAITALGLKQLAFVEASTGNVGKYLKAIDDGDAVDYEWATPPDTKYTLTHPSNTNNLVLNQNGSALNTITLGANAWNSTSIPTTYLKSASVSGSTLTLTKQDNGTVTFTDTNTTYSFQEGSTDGGFQYKVNSGSWQNVAVHNAATIAYVNEKAAGLSASYAINTSSSVNPAFNVQTASITVTSFTTVGGDTISFSDLKVGDTVYVTNSDVPDRWVGAVGSSNATLYVLETVKPAIASASLPLSINSSRDLSLNIGTGLQNDGGSLAIDDTHFGSNAFTSTSIPTVYVKNASVSGSTLTLTKQDNSTVSLTNTNTTYTFANGTNGFTVTPSGGTAQTVTVTPSITNNVTGSGTSGYLARFNGANTITNGPQLGSGTTTFLRNDGQWATPVGTTYTASDPISISSSKVVSLTMGNDLTTDGGALTHANSITAGTVSDGGSTRTLAFGGTFKIPSVTYDGHGHITSTSTITLTMPANPDTDTKVTQTATTTSAVYEVLFSATASNSTLTETARKNNNLTFNPSTGKLSSVIYTMLVGTTEKASMQYNSTTDAIDFVFVA